jgi:hypothetical protein
MLSQLSYPFAMGCAWALIPFRPLHPYQSCCGIMSVSICLAPRTRFRAFLARTNAAEHLFAASKLRTNGLSTVPAYPLLSSACRTVRASAFSACFHSFRFIVHPGTISGECSCLFYGFLAAQHFWCSDNRACCGLRILPSLLANDLSGHLECG